MKFATFAGAGALILATSAAFAAPCSTGTTGGRDSAASKSSTVDPGTTAKTTPGAKSESPGTVGAMNNAGAANTASSASDVQRQSEGKPTAAQAAKGGGDC